MKTPNMTRREFARVAVIGAGPASRLKITIIGDSSCIPDVRRETGIFS